MNARITLVDPERPPTNGDPKLDEAKYYIQCSEVPPLGGAGRLVIENVSRKEVHNPGGNPPVYEELRIETSTDPNMVPADPGMDLVINLAARLDFPPPENPPATIVLPYNGGVPYPPEHITIKLKF
jgi:hypothetical protein